MPQPIILTVINLLDDTEGTSADLTQKRVILTSLSDYTQLELSTILRFYNNIILDCDNKLSIPNRKDVNYTAIRQLRNTAFRFKELIQIQKLRSNK